MQLVERFLGRRVREFEGGAKIAGFKLKVKLLYSVRMASSSSSIASVWCTDESLLRS